MRGPPIANVLPDRTVSGQHAASPGTSTSRPGPSRRELRTWLKVSLHICLKGILCRVDGGEGGSGGGGGADAEGRPPPLGRGTSAQSRLHVAGPRPSRSVSCLPDAQMHRASRIPPLTHAARARRLLVLGEGAGPALPVFLACINRGEFCKALSTSSEVKCGRGATKQNEQQHRNEKKRERENYLS